MSPDESPEVRNLIEAKAKELIDSMEEEVTHEFLIVGASWQSSLYTPFVKSQVSEKEAQPIGVLLPFGLHPHVAIFVNVNVDGIRTPYHRSWSSDRLLFEHPSPASVPRCTSTTASSALPP